jgi:hypothetical protein
MTSSRTSTWQRPKTTPLAATLGALTMLGLSTVGCGSSGAKTTPDGGHDGGAGGGGAGGSTTDGGADTSTACTVGGSGMLVVAAAGLPAGTTMPMVRVSGGGLAMPMMLSVGTPVTLDARGGYEVDYRRVKVAPAGGGIVGKAYYVSASSFDGCVKSGATTTVTLTYTQEPASEHMWVSVSNAPTLGNELAGFASADLAATANLTPTMQADTIWKTQNFIGRPGPSAFDSSGNLWVMGGDIINMYPMMTLATPGSAPPMVVLTQPTTSKAKFAAFDSAGNLWVTRGNPGTDNQIVRYAFAALGASGSPTPDVILSSPLIMNPAGLAFAANGDLWVAIEGSAKVVRFNFDHLGASSMAPPDGSLGATTPAGAPVMFPYDHPNGVAFDQAGNLWVGFLGQLAAFTPTQQMTTTDMTIAGPLAVNVGTGTGGFAFDESGGVWYSDAMSKLKRIPKAMLMAGGDVTPDIVIDSSDLGYTEGFVLDPSPTWSFIQDWL